LAGELVRELGGSSPPTPAKVDLFRTAWVKAFIRIRNAEDPETVEILLSIGHH
jgi:hypothetical protein